MQDYPLVLSTLQFSGHKLHHATTTYFIIEISPWKTRLVGKFLQLLAENNQEAVIPLLHDMSVLVSSPF